MCFIFSSIYFDFFLNNATCCDSYSNIKLDSKCFKGD